MKTEIKIAKIPHGAKGVYSLTFDDGCYGDSTIETVEIFKKVQKETGVKIKATSTQTVNFISPSLLEMWKKLFADGYYDLTSHSVTHCVGYNTDTPEEKRIYEAQESKKRLEEMYNTNVITFAIPDGSDTDEGREVLKNYYTAVRSGHEYINDVDNLKWYDVGVFVAKFAYSSEDFISNIEKTAEIGGWGVQLNHWITYSETDKFHAQKADTFADECEYLAKKCATGEIAALSFNEAVKYYRERECAKLNVTEKEGKIIAKVVCPLEKEIFNQPLTLEISSDKEPHTEGYVFVNRNGKYYTDILPNGEVEILF